VEEVLKALQPDEAYFWATHNGAELDLLLFKRGRRIGIECKRADAPRLEFKITGVKGNRHKTRSQRVICVSAMLGGS